VLELLRLAGVKASERDFVPCQDQNAWQEGHSASVVAATHECRCGLLNLHLTEAWDVKGPVHAGTVWVLPSLLQGRTGRPRFQPISMNPPATRDIAVLANETEPAGKVQAALEKAASGAAGGAFAFESARIFDIYRGKGLPEGRKSLAFTLTFRSPERTLNDAEVNAAFEQVQKQIAEAGYPVRA
jgi:phenylalanyl-tRNA synthetase beta chain